MQPTIDGEYFSQLSERVIRIESMLADLRRKSIEREWYSVEEFAVAVEREPFTVRQWCRLGRILAKKHHSGRGKHQTWTISHIELERYRREGLAPLR